MSSFINAHALRERRKARGWDQLTLAREAGIDPSVVSRLERGLQADLRVSVLVALIRALDIPIEEILLLSPMHSPVNGDILELESLIFQIRHLPPPYQEQIIALIATYLATTPPLP